MSRYDCSVLSLKHNIINKTKNGFQIVKSATILKNNFKNVIYWLKIHEVDIQSESPLVKLTMAG